MLASGNTTAYMVYTNNLWDILPRHYLMKMAGAEVYTDKDNNFHIYANKEVIENIKKVLKI